MEHSRIIRNLKVKHAADAADAAIESLQSRNYIIDSCWKSAIFLGIFESAIEADIRENNLNNK